MKTTEEFKAKRMTMINNYNPDFDIVSLLSKVNDKTIEQMCIEYRSSKEYAEAFIKFLKKYNEIVGHTQYHPPLPDQTTIKSVDYFRYKTFKRMVCELFYQGINSIPEDILEYTITFKNTVATTHIVIGVLNDYDEDGEIAVGKIVNEFGCTIPLGKAHVQNLYLANRTNFYDEGLVDTILHALYLYGEEPSISTSYKSTPKRTKW